MGMPERPPTMGLSGTSQIRVPQKSTRQGRPKAHFWYKTESRKGRTCSARKEEAGTDSVGVLIVYNLQRPGLLYKGWDGAIARHPTNPRTLAPDPIYAATLVTAISPSNTSDMLE